MMEIRHKITGDVLLAVEADSLVGANLSGADLYRANLSDANLSDADLYGANLSGARGIISFGPIGGERRIGYAVDHGESAYVKLGCFWGTEIDARRAIEAKYGENSAYAALVFAACRALEAAR